MGKGKASLHVGFLAVTVLLAAAGILSAMQETVGLKITSVTVACLVLALLTLLLAVNPRVRELNIKLFGNELAVKLNQVDEKVDGLAEQVTKLETATENLNKLNRQLAMLVGQLPRAETSLPGGTPLRPRPDVRLPTADVERVLGETMATGRPMRLPSRMSDSKLDDWLSTHPVQDEEDPQRGRWGGQRECEGLVLDASVERAEISGFYSVSLRVRAAEGAAPPSGKVTFFLHDTFAKDRITVDFEGGRAHLDLMAWGAFVVGAWVHGRGVPVEINLESDVPTARQAFKDL